jgi:hypothetical protein
MVAKTAVKAIVRLAMALKLQTSERNDQILEANGRRNEAQS